MALPYQRDDEEQNDNGGMNVLSPNGQANQQSNQMNQTNQPDVSGGQSAAIGTGATGGSPAPTAKSPKKQASSGMYSNLNKYVQANQPAAQQMSQAAQQKFGSQAQQVGQQVQQQQNDFTSQVAANRARIQQAQQFGQQTTQKAAGQLSQEQLQAQQQALNTNLGRFGDLQEGGYQQNIQQYQQQQPQVQQSYQTAQQAQQQASTSYDDLVNQLAQKAVGKVINPLGGVSSRSSGYQPVTYNDQATAAKALKEGTLQVSQFITPQQQATIDAAKKYDDFIAAGGRGNYSGDILADMSASQQLINDPQLQQAKELYGITQQFDPTKLAYNTAQSQFQSAEQAQKQLETDLYNAQENQRLYENRDAMQSELNALQQKMDSAPEAVTPEEAQRFQNLTNGIERYDQVSFDIAKQKREAGQLSDLASQAERNDVRQELLRRSIGGQNYTGGKSSLDSLILGSDDAAREGLVRSVQEASKGLGEQIRGSEKETGRQFAELAGEGRTLQDTLKKGLTTEQEALQSELEQRLASGEGTLTKRLSDALESGKGLTEEDMKLLGLSADQRYYNLTPEQLKEIGTYDASKYSTQDVANLNDIARAKALASLAGQDQSMFADEDLIRRKTLTNILGGVPDSETGEIGSAQLAMGDKETAAALKAKMSGAENEYNQAKGAVTNKLKSDYGGYIAPVADMITSLVQNGSVGYEYGTVDLDKMLNGTQQEALNEAAKIAHTNYWAWAGRGQHGMSADPNAIISSVRQAYDQNQKVMQQYTPNQAGNIASATTARQNALKNLANIK